MTERCSTPSSSSLLASALAMAVAAFCMLACKESSQRVEESAAPSASGSSAEAPPSAATSAKQTASKEEAAPGSSDETNENLIFVTEAHVVASSLRDARSLTELAVDSRGDTSWRPNPTDPAPWISVALPSEARIHELVLNLGEQKAGRTVSLEVTRDGQGIGTATSTTATLRLRFDEPVSGGEFRWTATGKQRDAFAAGVVELHVSGTVPAALRLPRMFPSARVQGSEPRFTSSGTLFRSFWQQAPYPTLDAMCRAYHAIRAALPSEASEEDGQLPATSQCRLVRELRPEGAAPGDVRGVHIGSVEAGAADFLGISPRFPKLLFIHHVQGWFPSNLHVDDDRGSGDLRAAVFYHADVEAARWTGGVLELRVLRRYATTHPDGPGYTPIDVAGLTLMSCQLQASPKIARPVCRDALIAFGDPEGVGIRLVLPPGSIVDAGPRPPLLPESWLWQREHAIAPNGTLRFGPCQDRRQRPPVSVPCLAPGAHLLP